MAVDDHFAVDFGGVHVAASAPDALFDLLVDQHVDLVADERVAVLEGDLLLQRHQFVAAGELHFLGQMPFQLCGRRVGFE